MTTPAATRRCTIGADVQIAVVNSSKLPTADLAFFVEACRLQLIECAAAWGLPPLAAALYADTASLPASDVYICEVVDDLDQPGALGYHSDDGRPFLRIRAQGDATSITLSHEFLETLCDPTCDGWRARGDGTQVALEVCDPVEGDSYEQDATVLGETRQVRVSNYVLPAWFAQSTDPAMYDHLGRLTAPFSMDAGGYCVILDSTGNETETFARVAAGLAGHAVAGKRLVVRNSRLLRRLRWRR